MGRRTSICNYVGGEELVGQLLQVEWTGVVYVFHLLCSVCEDDEVYVTFSAETIHAPVMIFSSGQNNHLGRSVVHSYHTLKQSTFVAPL